MDTICEDVWLEIILQLDVLSAICLRKTCNFFAFIDTQSAAFRVYFTVATTNGTSSIHRGRKHGWSWGDSDNDCWYAKYNNGVVVERYSVTDVGYGDIIQINSAIYWHDHQNFNNNEIAICTCVYHASFHVVPGVTRAPTLFPQLQVEDDVHILAVSENFLNLQPHPHNESIFVRTLLQRDVSYCLDCRMCVYDEGACGCSGYSNSVSWYNDRETILASLKIHRPDVYALLPHEKHT
jgi:hypothetical protein